MVDVIFVYALDGDMLTCSQTEVNIKKLACFTRSQ